MNKTILACATLMGTIIGAGIFALPYIFSRSGVGLCLLYLFIISFIVALLHLFFGEVILRTEQESRLIGLAHRYLGAKAKITVGAGVLIGSLGSLLVYIILAGQFLSILFPFFLSAFQWSIVAWFILSFLVFWGTKPIALIEILLSGLLFLTGAAIIVFCLPAINPSHFFLWNHHNLFLPFGVFLFSLIGWSAVPECEDLLSKKRDLKKVIIISIVVCALFYALFGITISAVTGVHTTKEPFSGLAPFLGQGVISLAAVFGLLSVITSFLTIANYFKNTLCFDCKIPSIPAFLLAVFSPLVLFLAGLREFVVLISALGIFIGFIEGGAICLMWLKAKKQGTKAPSYTISLPNGSAYLVIAVLALGAFAWIFYH